MCFSQTQFGQSGFVQSGWTFGGQQKPLMPCVFFAEMDKNVAHDAQHQWNTLTPKTNKKVPNTEKSPK